MTRQKGVLLHLCTGEVDGGRGETGVGLETGYLLGLGQSDIGPQIIAN